jgi:outer membrane scaffolding protein for murein synthesis (MipA/OmpV family)
MRLRRFLAPALTAVLLSSPVAAAETATGALWELNLAAFGRSGPSYPASEETQFDLIPLPIPVYRGKVLRLFETNEKPIRGQIFRRERVRLDIDFDLIFGSDSEDIEARRGMPDLDLLLEFGPQLEWQYVEGGWLDTNAYLALQLRGAWSWDGLDPSWQGVVFSPEFKITRDLGLPRQQLKLRVTPTFATSNYMDYYYGVAPQFATAERLAFDADAGYLGTDVTLSIRQPLTDRLEFFAGLRQGFHRGASNDDSPLFTDSTTTAFYGAFSYRLWESKRRGQNRL